MESVKGLFVGQTVCVAVLDEERAEIFDAIVLDVAATGASANVVESSKCFPLLKEHGAGYIQAVRSHDEACEKGKELGRRVKAADIHPFTKEASTLVGKFKEVANQRAKLTTELKQVVAQITATAPKKMEKPKEK
jgi:anion-transporting  ArsA/GET3 family ATPase